ncbi:MAG TPA: CHAD domain-containing protein, partial [Dongiaceae bacterium]|nr:CHAD domain-containing protein [Dongiaceae bacterium]
LRGRVRALFAVTPAIPRARVAVAARRALRERAVAGVGARGRAVEDGPVAMHALRIAVKKYRYTLEFMDEVGLGRHAAALADARRVQDALGRLHDLDLLIALARRAPGAATPGLRALLGEERRPLLQAARAEAAAFAPKRAATPGSARGAASRRGASAPRRPGRSPLP